METRRRHSARFDERLSAAARREAGEPARIGLWDRALLRAAPGWAARRARARVAVERARSELSLLALSRRRYEAAAMSRRTEGWRARATSPREEIGPALSRLQARSRDLVRNNSYAGHGVEVCSTELVGAGLRARPMVDDDRRREALDVFRRWAEDVRVSADAPLDFYALQWQAVRAMAESGEVLIRRRIRRSTDGLEVPLQLQVLESDYIDTAKDEYSYGAVREQGTVTRQGIEYDAIGRRVAYWLYPEHPSDTSEQSRRVPASEILHLYEPDRPGQQRGVPWMAPAMLSARDLDDYMDARLLREKIASCYVGFVHDLVGDPAQQTEIGSFEEQDFEPGLVTSLPAGTTIDFARPPGVSGQEDFVRTALQGIAVSLPVTYESLTGNLRGTNFSSARMGRLDVEQVAKRRRAMLVVPCLLRPLWRWFCGAAAAARVEPFAQDPEMRATWTPPRREQMDPTRETSALRMRLRLGLISLSEALREQGYDPDEVFEELAEDREKLDELGVRLESVLPAGDPAAPDEGGGLEDPEDPEDPDDDDDDDGSDGPEERRALIREIAAELVAEQLDGNPVG